LESSEVPCSDIENDIEWIYFYAPLAKAELMMDTEFFYFTQNADKSHTKRIRTLKYSVPSELTNHIAMIQPTTRFGQMKPERSTVFDTELFSTAVNSEADVLAVPNMNLNVTACNATITPDCLRALYSIGDYQADPTCGSLFGICGYLKEYAKYDAFDLFLEKYAPYAAGEQNFTYVLVNGGLATQNDTVDEDIEANLDIQYAASLGYNDNSITTAPVAWAFLSRILMNHTNPATEMSRISTFSATS
jgi:tripeptidyl-peptidase-1